MAILKLEIDVFGIASKNCQIPSDFAFAITLLSESLFSKSCLESNKSVDLNEVPLLS